MLYKCSYHYGYPLGDACEEPQGIAQYIVDKNGHILPYVHFKGGAMSLRKEALDIFGDALCKIVILPMPFGERARRENGYVKVELGALEKLPIPE